MTEEDIARVAHEVNRAYCRAIGDDTQMPWEMCAEWQKDSAINGVRFHLENRDATPEESHENWLRQKLDEGWTYGRTKDPDLLKHPCIMPYGDLPQEQRVKDHLFIGVVRSLAPYLHRRRGGSSGPLRDEKRAPGL